MMTLRFPLIGALLTALAIPAFAESSPKFEEVYKLLQENLGGVSAEELNQAALKGLLSQYPSRVMLGSAINQTPAVDESLTETRTLLFDGAVEYFRLGKVAGDAAEKLASAHSQLLSTNKGRVRGVVLDLRFSSGFDYASAGAVANLFLDADQPLLSWSGGVARATQKTNAITVPLAILVNSQTTGAAEALAGALREANVGLIIGSVTSGQSSVYKEFPLSDGSTLRLAVEQVKVGMGKPLAGIKPDIAMTVSLDDERAYMKDPYAVLHKIGAAAVTSTNQATDTSIGTTRRRMNEAELVRLQKEGADPDDDEATPVAKQESPRPTLTDPVLVRGVDLVKALAVVQQGKSKN